MMVRSALPEGGIVRWNVIATFGVVHNEMAGDKTEKCGVRFGRTSDPGWR